jgi:outer membrane protein assembly factor BamD
MSLLRIITIFSLSIYLFGCSSPEKNADTPEGAFAIAQEYEKDERYDLAIQKYQVIRNKYIYSKYALMAELAIADCYYKQESFPEAQIAYQAFKDFHPKNAQADYVTFRLAMSYFKQLPTSIDRDLSLAGQAVSHFDELIHNYPQSQYIKEAQENKIAALKMLAEKEIYIADFYFRKGNYASALGRYENEFAKYPGLGFDEIALSKAAISAARNGQQEKAKELLARLKAKFPTSSELESTEREVNR